MGSQKFVKAELIIMRDLIESLLSEEIDKESLYVDLDRLDKSLGFLFVLEKQLHLEEGE